MAIKKSRLDKESGTKVVMVNSFRGGTGKSTIVSNLASFLAQTGLKVILIDADIISPGIHAIFGLDKTTFNATLSDFLLGQKPIEDAVYDISPKIGLDSDKLLLVPSSIAPGEITEVLLTSGNEERLRKAIKKLSKLYKPDYIMTDTHPGLNEEMLLTTSFADTYLNIVRPDNQDYQGAEVTTTISKKLGADTHIILNKVHKRVNKSEVVKKIETLFSYPVSGILPFSEDILFGESKHVFVNEYPDHPFSIEIQHIAANVFNVKPKESIEMMHLLLQKIKGNNNKIEMIALLKLTHLKEKDFAEYADQLLEQNYLQLCEEGGKRVLSMQEKGKRFLAEYATIRKFIKNFRL